MPLNVPAGCGIASYRFMADGDPEEMVVTLGVDATAFPGSGDDLATALATAWGDNYPPSAMDAQWRFVGVTFRWRETAAPDLIPYEFLANSQGTQANQTLPQNCAVLVRKITASAGRKNRGRMFMPPFSLGEANVDQIGVIDPTLRTNLETSWNGWRSQVGSDAGIPVILHNSTASGPGGPPTPITDFQVDNVIATRRLRLRK